MLSRRRSISLRQREILRFAQNDKESKHKAVGIRRLVEETGWEYDLGKLTEDSTRYLLEEYAGTAIYKNFVNTQTQVYWGIYIQDTEVFNRHSPEVDLKLPITLPVTNNRLGASIASIQTPIRKTA